MDDTVALLDNYGSSRNAPVVKGCVVVSDQHPAQDLVASAFNGAEGSPHTPPSPSMLQQRQELCDAASTNSDGSQDLADSTSSSTKQHGPPRRTHSHVDVDVAKQAAMSALAGLDLTTTKANLDASKAAAATARANGELPAHVRKSNLRSVSCRQLGTGGVGKSVAFADDTTKPKPVEGATRSVQFKFGTAGASATSTQDGSQPRRTTRAPASRCISLPHVLQGRAGMANRLAATHAQDAALQQQLQLFNGSSHTSHGFAGASNQVQANMPSMDVLSMYHLQQQANGQLLGQRSLGGTTVATVDDSVLHLRSGNTLLAVQQQQQQQTSRLAGNWPATASAQQCVNWGPGTAQVTQQAALANPQLLLQLQSSPQGVAGASGSNETLWLQSPAAASAALLAANGPQNMVLANQGLGANGLPGLAEGSSLLSPSAQQAVVGGSSSAACGTMMTLFSQLCERYQTVSWTLLAAAQADSSIKEQLLTEVVLQLTLLHTLDGVLKSTLGSAEAVNDLRYLCAASRRHLATFTQLSQAGDLAVQVLAMIAPLACRHLTTSEVVEASFLVLDTLALANRDVAAVVSQQRLNALSNLLVQLPVDQLLQQQTLCLTWINTMTTAVTRNKQMLENITGADGTTASQAAASAGLMQSNTAAAAGALSLTGMPLASQPLMVSPTAPSLSPTGKTPLATYFEQGPPSGLLSPSAITPPAAAELNAFHGLRPAAATDTLLHDSLAGFSISPHVPAAVGPDSGSGLAGLQLGAAPGLASGTGAGATTSRPYSPLESGLPLFGNTSLLVPSSTGSSGTGAPTGIVGV